MPGVYIPPRRVAVQSGAGPSVTVGDQWRAGQRPMNRWWSPAQNVSRYQGDQNPVLDLRQKVQDQAERRKGRF